MQKSCEVCGKGFDAERVTARYCTPQCRKLAFHSGKVSVLSVPEKVGISPHSVPKSPSVPDSVLDLKLIDPNDPEVIEEGMVIAEEKKREMNATTLPVVSLDEPCKVDAGIDRGETYLDLEKDLHLDLKRDLGIYSWTKDGIFIRPDITIQQVRNIRRLVEARHGWPHRAYDDENPLPYSTSKSSSVRA